MKEFAARRLPSLVVLTVLLALLVVPAGAASPDNPFRGSWVADFDGANAQMQFGGNGHFHLRAVSSTFCEESAPLTLLGTFEPDTPQTQCRQQDSVAPPG